MSNSQLKPKNLFSNCISIVSRFVESHDPLQFELIDMTKGVFVLRNTATAISMNDNSRFYILRVKNSKGLYLHVSVTVKAPYPGASIETNHDFEGISVQFLQGTGRLFCRAEWDVKKKMGKLEHPQPHWHWGGGKVEDKPLAFVATEAMEGQGGGFMKELSTDEPSLPSIDFQELHYAMATKWATHDIAIEEFTLQRLYNWLKNSIANIIDQYNYQVNKDSFVSSKVW